MPRPPPPNAALNITGRPCCLQKSTASSVVLIGPGVPGTMGTPAVWNIMLEIFLSIQQSLKIVTDVILIPH